MLNRSKFVSVVGARPQFIKASVLSRALLKYHDIEEVVVHTGQHFDTNMSEIFFSEMSIPSPHYNLGIGGGTHGQNTGRMIEKLEEILLKERPKCVVLYGDTDSTLAGAIVASKLVIPIAHIESGLRSFRQDMPEEINRVLTDRLSDVLYVPSSKAINNLICEGIIHNKIINTGDIMFDAVLQFKDLSNEKSMILEKLGISGYEYNLLTLHRKENVDNPEVLSGIVCALGQCKTKVVFPIHPRTMRRMNDYQVILPQNVIAIDPIGYLDNLKLIQYAKIILTDSGGVQKEAYFLRRPCIILRQETEWTELVECGANLLSGVNPESILECCSKVSFPLCSNYIYGNGSASEIIAKDLRNRYCF